MSLSILLVDDEPLILQCIGEALRDSGHTVQVSGDGVDALALVLRRSFDLVICDVQLPSLDGLSVLKRAREEAPHTEFLMITGRASVPDAVTAVRAGSLDYLPKPFGIEPLLAQVEEVKRRRAARTGPAGIVPLAGAVRAFEKEHLARALHAMGGKRAETAAALGISRKCLWEKIRAYGLKAGRSA